jgi:HNH endonuclease
MVFIPKSLRDLVVKRAKGRCEYCQTAQVIVIEMEIDHIIPVSLGGKTIAANLANTCGSCNGFKLDAVSAVDPETGETVSLFNPRAQVWREHFQWSEDGTQLIGLTPVGRATIERLKINREIAVLARERWVKAGWHPPRN